MDKSGKLQIMALLSRGVRIDAFVHTQTTRKYYLRLKTVILLATTMSMSTTTAPAELAHWINSYSIDKFLGF